jgi:hypothetical protein
LANLTNASQNVHNSKFIQGDSVPNFSYGMSGKSRMSKSSRKHPFVEFVGLQFLPTIFGQIRIKIQAIIMRH